MLPMTFRAASFDVFSCIAQIYMITQLYMILIYMISDCSNIHDYINIHDSVVTRCYLRHYQKMALNPQNYTFTKTMDMTFLQPTYTDVINDEVKFKIFKMPFLV